MLYKQGLNLAHEGKHHLGLYFEHDTKDFKRLWAQLGFTPEGDHSGFLRADLQKHFVSIGHVHKHCSCATHAFELAYNAADGAKGLHGFPVEAKVGAELKFSDHVVLKANARAGEHYAAEAKLDYKVDNNWSVATHQDFSSAKLKDKSGPYSLGFKVNYKL